jgi:hypothetical protein
MALSLRKCDKNQDKDVQRGQKNVENQSVQSHCSRPRNPVTEPAIDDPMKEELLEVMPPPKPV